MSQSKFSPSSDSSDEGSCRSSCSSHECRRERERVSGVPLHHLFEAASVEIGFLFSEEALEILIRQDGTMWVITNEVLQDPKENIDRVVVCNGTLYLDSRKAKNNVHLARPLLHSKGEKYNFPESGLPLFVSKKQLNVIRLFKVAIHYKYRGGTGSPTTWALQKFGLELTLVESSRLKAILKVLNQPKYSTVEVEKP